MNSVVEVTDASFEDEVLKSDIPVLIDFWAEWCGPCKVLSPIIDEVSKDYEGRIIDENPNNTQKFGIRGIPTLIIFKNGDKEETSVGVLSKSELTSFLDKSL